jgi:hypothetical protein
MMDDSPKADAAPGDKPTTGPIDMSPEACARRDEMVWELTVAEWKRRGLEIPEFDRNIEGIIRLSEKE